MLEKRICKLLRDIMLTKDPHCFQNSTLCDCSYFCHVQQNYGTDDTQYFPKNFEEYIKIRDKIISEHNILKRNLPDEKDS